MPLYNYKCKCGEEFEIALSVSEYDNFKPNKCNCGGDMKRDYSFLNLSVRGKGLERIDESGVVESPGTGVDLSGYTTIHDKPVGEIKDVPRGQIKR